MSEDLPTKKEGENPLRVYLRESKTLTSTIYPRTPDDSFFLFFTDDAAAPRPNLGALNLASAWERPRSVC